MQNTQTMENPTELDRNWSEQKDNLIQRFANLTDNDLMFGEGKKAEMLGKLDVILGKNKEQLNENIEEP